MREMPYGQWVAFDGYDSIHNCGQVSEYDAEPTASTHRSDSSGGRTTAPVSAPPSFRPAAPATERSEDSRKDKGWPAWIWWLIAIVALYFLFKK